MTDTNKPKWVSCKVASEYLGCSISHLAKLRKDGTLKRRRHWKNIGRKMAMRPTYRYNLTAIERDFV